MRKTISILALLIVAIMGVGSLVSCGNQPGTVQGAVRQAPGGQPVAQAQILVYGLEEVEEVTFMDAFEKGSILQTLVTDESGAYSVSLNPASYLFEVRAEGLETTSQLVEVKSGRDVTVDFDLASPSP